MINLNLKLKRKKKTNKPRELQFDTQYYCVEGSPEVFIYCDGVYIKHKRARKLAAWLNKAADYLESKNDPKT